MIIMTNMIVVISVAVAVEVRRLERARAYYGPSIDIIISMLTCSSASRCQCREGHLHLDARCEQMQGAGLHLASRCEKMQTPEQFQATDALEKPPQNCIFCCTKVLYATIRHFWCFTRHIWFRSWSIPPVLSPFMTTFPTCPGEDANNAGIQPASRCRLHLDAGSRPCI